jgi:3-oxoacyl-[acyl-carrier-protein] synthase III
MSTSIQAISCALPERELTNAELARLHPSWDMERAVQGAGVVSRRIAGADETSLDLSVRACEKLVEEHGLDLTRIDAIVYCTQTPDHTAPGNAHLLHHQLGLGDDVAAFDYTLACSGYVYGVAIADSFVRSGLASEVLLITADTMSKLISPEDRAVVTLFGDGAAATHLSAGEHGGGRVCAVRLCSHGGAHGRFYVPAGGARTPSTAETRRKATDRHGAVRSLEDVHMDGPGVWAFANSTVPAHVRSFLADQGLTLDDVDLYVFHQASKVILDTLARALRLDADRVFAHMDRTGNLSSASIPFALRAALDEGAVPPGGRVLLSAYGAGMSYGSVLVEY